MRARAAGRGGEQQLRRRTGAVSGARARGRAAASERGSSSSGDVRACGQRRKGNSNNTNGTGKHRSWLSSCHLCSAGAAARRELGAGRRREERVAAAQTAAEQLHIMLASSSMTSGKLRWVSLDMGSALGSLVKKHRTELDMCRLDDPNR